MAADRSERRGRRREEAAVGPALPRRARASTAGNETFTLFGRSTEASSRQDGDWQRLAYELTKAVPALRYPVNLVANGLRRGRIRILVEETNGDRRELSADGEDGDPQAVIDAVDRVRRAFRDPLGSQGGLLRSCAYHDQVAGEFYLVAKDVSGEQPAEPGVTLVTEWEAVSVLELTPDTTGGAASSSEVEMFKRKPSGTGQGTPVTTADHYIVRYHVADPAFSQRSTSPVEGVVTSARIVHAINMLIAARADAQRAAKGLFVPAELTLDDDDDIEADAENPDDDETGESTMLARIREHMVAAVQADSTLAALVPFLLEGPAEFGDKIKTFDLGSEIPAQLSELKAEAIREIAIGLDVPPEIVEGKASLNHWSAYQVDADLVSKHITPVAERLEEFLTEAWLRATLAEAEADAVPAEWRSRLVVEIDLSALAARTDAATTSRALYDRGKLSAAAMLIANGFDEADMPDEAEALEQLILELIRMAPVSNGWLLEHLPRLTAAGITPPPPVDENGIPIESPAPEAAPPPNGDAPVNAEPADGDGGGEPEQPDSLTQRVLAAADSAMERALERAANRVRTRSRSYRPLAERIDGLASQQILAAVTAEDLALIGAPPADLLFSSWDQFRQQVMVWVQLDLRARGWAAAAACDEAGRVADDLVAALDEYATENLHTGLSRIPTGFLVPEVLIADVMAGVPC